MKSQPKSNGPPKPTPSAPPAASVGAGANAAADLAPRDSRGASSSSPPHDSRGASAAAPPAGGAPPHDAARSRERRRERRLSRRERTRRRILKTTAILPSMFTIGNGLMGFASIYLATRQGVNGEPTQLALAAWLLFAAMFCDMIDGRLARFTRQTSDFGGQLDSMCDVISFGVAPPILMLRAVTGAAHEQVGKVFVFAQFSNIGLERLLWCLAAVYVAGAAMRLARFNVENVPDESAHMDFRGLPSPGAAAAVATLVLLFVHLQNITAGGWLFGPWLLSTNERIAEAMAVVICVMLPLVTLATGLLMVSRFRYAHVVNQYIRGKRPFSYLVKLVVLGLLAVMEPYLALAGAAVVYAFSAPLTAAFLHLRRPPAAPAGPAAGPGVPPPK